MTDDANLTEQEVNALLNGHDPTENPRIANILKAARKGHADILSGMLGTNVTFPEKAFRLGDKLDIIDILPEDIIEVSVPFEGEFSGPHSFVIGADDFPTIAGLMMGQEDIEVDEAALSALGEAISSLVASAVTTIEQEFKVSINSMPPQISQIKKDDLSLSDSVYYSSTEMVIEGHDPIIIIEAFGIEVADAITNAIDKGENDQAPAASSETKSDNNSEAMTIQGIQLPDLLDVELTPQKQKNLGLLMDVSMELTVELGRTKWQLRDILTMGEGTIVELDKQAGEPVDILVNRNLVARGEVVVVDENFSVRITEIVSGIEKMMAFQDN